MSAFAGKQQQNGGDPLFFICLELHVSPVEGRHFRFWQVELLLDKVLQHFNIESLANIRLPVRKDSMAHTGRCLHSGEFQWPKTKGLAFVDLDFEQDRPAGFIKLQIRDRSEVDIPLGLISSPHGFEGSADHAHVENVSSLQWDKPTHIDERKRFHT